MIDILLDHKFYYYDESITYTFLDSAISSPSAVTVVTKNSSGNTIDTKNDITDAYGVVSNTILVTKAKYPAGTYTITATRGIVSTVETFIIGYEANLIANAITSLLQGFLEIPVYDEMGIPTSDNYVKFSFSNWLCDSSKPPTFIKNNAALALYQYAYPDYVNGKILVKPAYVSGDDIYSSYKFKFFSELDFWSFLDLALDMINAVPPATSYTFETAPRIFDPYLALKTYSLCLKQILLNIEFWNNRLIFPEPSGLRGTLNQLLASAELETTALIPHIKNRRYLRPQGITSFKIGIPYTLDGLNMRMYTVASITGGTAGPSVL